MGGTTLPWGITLQPGLASTVIDTLDYWISLRISTPIMQDHIYKHVQKIYADGDPSPSAATPHPEVVLYPEILAMYPPAVDPENSRFAPLLRGPTSSETAVIKAHIRETWKVNPSLFVSPIFFSESQYASNDWATGQNLPSKRPNRVGM